LRTYGLPDFTALSLTNPQDRQRIRWALEQAVAVFEPRLDRVRVTVETPQQHEQALRLRVEALLRMEPAPIPVAFDATLLKTHGIYGTGDRLMLESRPPAFPRPSPQGTPISPTLLHPELHVQAALGRAPPGCGALRRVAAAGWG